MTDDSTRIMDRRGFVRAGIGLGTAAAIAQPATAQDDPYNGWFDDADNFEGTVDYSGEETVNVTVGAGSDGLLFEPAAIQVDPGTTVVWEWTGEGGEHNVAEEDGVFESDQVADEGHTFEYTFEEDETDAVYRYVCTPHEALGMVGAVAVGDVVGETIDPDGAGEEDVDETAPAGGGSLSDEGILATIAGVLVLGLLSPVLFAVLLKFVYDREGPAE